MSLLLLFFVFYFGLNLSIYIGFEIIFFMKRSIRFTKVNWMKNSESIKDWTSQDINSLTLSRPCLAQESTIELDRLSTRMNESNLLQVHNRQGNEIKKLLRFSSLIFKLTCIKRIHFLLLGTLMSFSKNTI